MDEAYKYVCLEEDLLQQILRYLLQQVKKNTQGNKEQTQSNKHSWQGKKGNSQQKGRVHGWKFEVVFTKLNVPYELIFQELCKSPNQLETFNKKINKNIVLSLSIWT